MTSTAHNKPPITLPLQLKALNAIGPLLEKVDLLNLSEDPEVYMRRAQKKTDLENFGPYDLREPLRRMLYTMKHDAHLNLFGRIGAIQMTMRNLMNNLLLEHEFQTNPAVREVDVEEPIIIICTPRTGSTLLHNLLNQHPQVRAAKMWELHRPCPPTRPENEFNDIRIKQSDREFGMFYRLVPEMRAIHFFAPEAIEECTHLFGNIFTCRLSFSTLANSSSYSDWAFATPMDDAYRAYKRYLQVLKLNYPGTFLVLKSPGHILQLEALEAVFPRARIIHLHRDPATAAGSFCSLTEAVQIAMRQHVDTHAIGDMWKTFWTPAMLNSISWRQQTDMQVIDIDFKSLVKTPVKTIQSIFEAFDKNVPETLENDINQYLNDHPKDEYGIHEYSLERYGLSRDVLYQDYKAYIDYYNVTLEQQAL